MIIILLFTVISLCASEASQLNPLCAAFVPQSFVSDIDAGYAPLPSLTFSPTHQFPKACVPYPPVPTRDRRAPLIATPPAMCEQEKTVPTVHPATQPKKAPTPVPLPKESLEPFHPLVDSLFYTLITGIEQSCTAPAEFNPLLYTLCLTCKDIWQSRVVDKVDLLRVPLLLFTAALWNQSKSMDIYSWMQQGSFQNFINKVCKYPSNPKIWRHLNVHSLNSGNMRPFNTNFFSRRFVLMLSQRIQHFGQEYFPHTVAFTSDASLSTTPQHPFPERPTIQLALTVLDMQKDYAQKLKDLFPEGPLFDIVTHLEKKTLVQQRYLCILPFFCYLYNNKDTISKQTVSRKQCVSWLLQASIDKDLAVQMDPFLAPLLSHSLYNYVDGTVAEQLRHALLHQDCLELLDDALGGPQQLGEDPASTPKALPLIRNNISSVVKALKTDNPPLHKILSAINVHTIREENWCVSYWATLYLFYKAVSLDAGKELMDSIQLAQDNKELPSATAGTIQQFIDRALTNHTLLKALFKDSAWHALWGSDYYTAKHDPESLDTPQCISPQGHFEFCTDTLKVCKAHYCRAFSRFLTSQLGGLNRYNTFVPPNGTY